MTEVIPGPYSVTSTDTAKNGSDSKSVTTSSSVLFAANSARIEAWIFNTHATQTLDLGLGVAAVANKGIRVAPGAGVVINSFTGAINGIASGSSTTVQITEV